MFLGVNNGHASESKCNYFMAGEKTKYVNHEIYYEIYINLELNYMKRMMFLHFLHLIFKISYFVKYCDKHQEKKLHIRNILK